MNTSSYNEVPKAPYFQASRPSLDAAVAIVRNQLKNLLEREPSLERFWTAKTKADALRPMELARAGIVLGKLGDPRRSVVPRTIDELAQMEFCYVPPGKFWRGDPTEGGWDDSMQEGFWIGRFPVTVAQYDLFANDGYQRREWWTDAEQAGVWRPTGEVKGLFESRWHAGRLSAGEEFDSPNHPVMNVNHFEAKAFIQWINEELQDRLPTGFQFALPSEWEWEKAARGGAMIASPALIRSVAHPDGLIVPPQWALVPNPEEKRPYAWRGNFDKNRVNSEFSGIFTTSAAGCYVANAAECGAQDMSGNVFEWCEDWYSPQLRVLRGGSWADGFPPNLSCSHRFYRAPDRRRPDAGFRCVVVGLGSAPRWQRQTNGPDTAWALRLPDPTKKSPNRPPHASEEPGERRGRRRGR